MGKILIAEGSRAYFSMGMTATSQMITWRIFYLDHDIKVLEK